MTEYGTPRPFSDQTGKLGWQAHRFALSSGFPRSVADVQAIEQAVGFSRDFRTYADGEHLLQVWGAAPATTDRVVLYLRASIDYYEAMEDWEPRWKESPTETRAALEMLAGFASGPRQ